MARVSAAEAPLPDGKQKLQVITKNCVPDEQIRAQVAYTQDLGLPFAPFCQPHGETAVMVSAGPSWTGHIEEIRAHSEAGRPVFCVKHAHDGLLKAGIVPFGCVLLDPRDHVADFVSDPHPEVRYFVATMVHRTTIDRLVERNARVFLYHALVGAGEDKIAKSGLMVSGGSSSSTRALPLLRALGFRRFVLYGYDSCFFDEKEDEKRMTVEVNGRKFVSTAELIAQSQDFEKLIKSLPGCSFEVHGPGMIPHVWRILDHADVPDTFEKVFA